jgi:hypothetical protein
MLPGGTCELSLLTQSLLQSPQTARGFATESPRLSEVDAALHPKLTSIQSTTSIPSITQPIHHWPKTQPCNPPPTPALVCWQCLFTPSRDPKHTLLPSCPSRPSCSSWRDSLPPSDTLPKGNLCTRLNPLPHNPLRPLAASFFPKSKGGGTMETTPRRNLPTTHYPLPTTHCPLPTKCRVAKKKS